MRFCFFVVVIGELLTSIHVDGKPLHRRGLRVEKRWEDDSSTNYVEQCGTIAFPIGQRGAVNVLAFLDSSWPYSHRQAIMLKILNERLRRSGMPDVRFYAINVDGSTSRYYDAAEDDVERETWLGVSSDEIEALSANVKITDSLETIANYGITFIQDNYVDNYWKKLGGSRDEVLVVDRCGKLTYQVIVPWSILHFPYVKAAILSTYNDEPCGRCDVEIEPQRLTLDRQTESVSIADQYFGIYGENRVPAVTTEYSIEKMIDSVEENSTDSSDNSNNSVTFAGDLEDATKIVTDLSTISDDDRKNVIPTVIASESTTQRNETANSWTTPNSEFDEKSVSQSSTDNDMSNANKVNATTIVAIPSNEFAKENNEDDDTTKDPNFRLPLRIIMHAPHVHTDHDDSTRMHEYVVLETGSTEDRHRHLDLHDAARYYLGPHDRHELPDYHRRSEIENKNWPMTNVIYNRDESPGRYGEAPDYWKYSDNYDNGHSEKTKTSNIEEYTKQPNPDEIIWQKSTETSNNINVSENKLIVSDPTTEINEKLEFGIIEESILDERTDGDSSYDDEEETRSRLIAHYSKLLPWIYYDLEE